MYFINEKDITFFEVREQPGQVASLLDGGAAGVFNVGAHRFGDDVRESGFAQTGRPAQEDMIDRLFAFFGRGHGDLDPIFNFILAGKLREEGRPEG